MMPPDHIGGPTASLADVAIPEFKFIGYDHPEYRVVVEQNGALSFGTQQIDSLDMVNNILTDKAKKEYVEPANHPCASTVPRPSTTCCLRAHSPSWLPNCSHCMRCR